MVTVQGCTRVPMLKDFKYFLIKNWLAHFLFVRMGDIPHKHSLITHSSHSNFFFYLVHVNWMTHRINDEYETNLGLISFRHDIGTWLTQPYAHVQL